MGVVKKLLDRSLRPLIWFALIVLVASIPVYFLIINLIWVRELDKHHYSVREKIVERVAALAASGDSVDSTIAILNKIQPGFSFSEGGTEVASDSVYNVIRFDSFMKDREQFRCLLTHIVIDGKPYKLLIETNMEEVDETIMSISAITIFLLILLLAGFIWLNRKTSLRIWKPFYNTIDKLKEFNLKDGRSVDFKNSDISEFEDLNGSLEMLIHKNLASYKQQKEFTENASHELQTPLSIVKTKTDLLLQTPGINDQQLHIIEEVNQAVNRVSRISKNLLIMAKIENDQFESKEEIDVSRVVDTLSRSFTDNFPVYKWSHQLDPDVVTTGNKILFEIVVSNLLTNAVRYTPAGGDIQVILIHNSLSVRNTGSESLKLENLFRRFSNSSSSSIGSGLGLAIVKEICDRHQWQIAYSFSEHMHVFKLTL